MLTGILVAFDLLSKDSSKSGKEAILRDCMNANNKNFLEVLKFVYNPFIVTGISTKKINKKVKDPEVANKGDLEMYPDITKLMDFLKRRNTGTDYDLFVVHRFIDQCRTNREREFVVDVVTKNLKVGITEKTINKVYGKGTIPSYGVMLAESYEKKEAKVKGKFYVTLKLDGNRATAIKEGGKVKFFTRKGQPIDGMNQLIEEISALPDGVYDGELLLVNKDKLSSADLFRATQKVVRKDGEKKDLEFHIFDTVTVSEFEEGKSSRTYEQRRNYLDILFNERATNDFVFTKKLPVLYQGEDKQVIARLMVWAEENGYEGLMVNTADGLYVTKRTSDLLKVKKMKTADLLVMSLEKAIDGQFEGKMARVNVEYKGGLVGVGSGFTIEDRDKFVADPDLIVGKIIEVQYFEESKDEKTGQPSLRFPVFKGIRHDKDVDDINYGE